jgi:hypothetical protein
VELRVVVGDAEDLGQLGDDRRRIDVLERGSEIADVAADLVACLDVMGRPALGMAPVTGGADAPGLGLADMSWLAAGDWAALAAALGAALAAAPGALGAGLNGGPKVQPAPASPQATQVRPDDRREIRRFVRHRRTGRSRRSGQGIAGRIRVSVSGSGSAGVLLQRIHPSMVTARQQARS